MTERVAVPFFPMRELNEKLEIEVCKGLVRESARETIFFRILSLCLPPNLFIHPERLGEDLCYAAKLFDTSVLQEKCYVKTQVTASKCVITDLLS